MGANLRFVNIVGFLLRASVCRIREKQENGSFLVCVRTSVEILNGKKIDVFAFAWEQS